MLFRVRRNLPEDIGVAGIDTRLVFRDLILVDKLLQVASEIHILFIIREARLEGEHIILGEIAGVGGYLLAQLGKLLGLLADAIVISRTKERQSPSVSVRFMEEKMDSPRGKPVQQGRAVIFLPVLQRFPIGLLQLLQLGIYLEDTPVHVRQTFFQFLPFPVDDLLQAQALRRPVGYLIQHLSFIFQILDNQCLGLVDIFNLPPPIYAKREWISSKRFGSPPLAVKLSNCSLSYPDLRSSSSAFCVRSPPR